MSLIPTISSAVSTYENTFEANTDQIRRKKIATFIGEVKKASAKLDSPEFKKKVSNMVTKYLETESSGDLKIQLLNLPDWVIKKEIEEQGVEYGHDGRSFGVESQKSSYPELQALLEKIRKNEVIPLLKCSEDKDVPSPKTGVLKGAVYVVIPSEKLSSDLLKSLKREALL